MQSSPFQRLIKIIGLILFFLQTQCYGQNQTPSQTPSQTPVNAQSKSFGKVNGQIFDSISHRPLDYVSIGLINALNSQIVAGITSDEKGNFMLSIPSPGSYFLLLNFIGYKTLKTGVFIVSKAQPNFTFKSILLAPSQLTLKEVKVTSEKPVIENKIDKLIYHVDQDLTSQGGVATDVLKKIPQVDVDVNGNVELQGNSNILFLIDGKPSTLFGSTISDALATIPASQIQSIEVLTSPGAKYDANGTGGIINIILKKNKQQGYNTNLSLTIGTRLENEAFRFAFKKEKLGINVFVNSNALLPSSTPSSMSRASLDPTLNQTTFLSENGLGTFRRNGFQTGAGFEFEPNAKSFWSGGLTYNTYYTATINQLNKSEAVFDPAGVLLNSSFSNPIANTSYNSNTADFNLFYKYQFVPHKSEISILGTSSLGNTSNNFNQNSTNGSNPGQDVESALAIDYVKTYTDSSLVETIESGLKTSTSNLNSQNNYSNLPNFSFIYSRQIAAIYSSIGFKLPHQVQLRLGLRDEYTLPSIANNYNNFIPSVAISKKLKSNQSLKLAYSHRIQRPEYRDLNPFINASDPSNITIGNPNLRPEIADKLEFTYSKFFEHGINLSIIAFYRGQRDDIQPYEVIYPQLKIGDSVYSNVAASIRQNIGREDNYGLNFFGSFPIVPHLTLRANLSGYQRYIWVGSLSGQNINAFNYRINANLTYQISSKITAEFFGNFNSPRLNIQGTMPMFTTYNFAIRTQIFNKQGSLALTTTNPFNEYVDQKVVLNGNNFTLITDKQIPYRSIGLNFTYKFGKMTFKKEKELEDPNLTNPPQP